MVFENVVDGDPNDAKNGYNEVPPISPRLPIAIGGEGNHFHDDLHDEANGQGGRSVAQGVANGVCIQAKVSITGKGALIGQNFKV